MHHWRSSGGSVRRRLRTALGYADQNDSRTDDLNGDPLVVFRTSMQARETKAPLPHMCRICGAGSVQLIEAREVMHGTSEPFTYLECHDCGTLQIADFPADMSRFYPVNYYSFRELWQNHSKLRTLVKRLMLPLAIRLPATPLGTYFNKHAPWLLQIPGLRNHSRILDVGCGKGHLL